MNSVWKKKQKAQEDDYFDKKEKEILDKLRSKPEQADTAGKSQDSNSSSNNKPNRTKTEDPDDLI